MRKRHQEVGDENEEKKEQLRKGRKIARKEEEKAQREGRA